MGTKIQYQVLSGIFRRGGGGGGANDNVWHMAVAVGRR